MDIICEHCQSKFKIADDKIPRGKAAVLNCPKCKNKITIPPAPMDSEPDAGEPGANEANGSDIYDASEKPFDFIEEEGKTALICESEPSVQKILMSTLNLMEYHTTNAENIRDALTKMRYHNYDLILVNENFDTANPEENAVLLYLERQPMSVRRYIFVVLISDRFRTMDNMMAFNKSVNMIINTKNISDIEKILKRGIADNDFSYRVFKDTLKETGRV
jgi:predicted Zn finger-like uncharacterized protein